MIGTQNCPWTGYCKTDAAEVVITSSSVQQNVGTAAAAAASADAKFFYRDHSETRPWRVEMRTWCAEKKAVGFRDATNGGLVDRAV